MITRICEVATTAWPDRMPVASRWAAQLLPSQGGVRTCDKFADTTGSLQRKAAETFTFVGDNDVGLFINNKLVTTRLPTRRSCSNAAQASKQANKRYWHDVFGSIQWLT